MEALYIILIASIQISTEVYLDKKQFKSLGFVSHYLGVGLRVIASILLVILFGYRSLYLYGGIFWLVFDPIMGYIIAKNIFHMGKTSLTGRFFHWVFGKWEFKYIFYFAIRTIWLCPMIIGHYFWPELLIDLWIEILGWF